MSDKLEIGLLQAKIEVQQFQMGILREEIDDHISQLLSSIKMILGVTGRNFLAVSDTLETAQATLATAIRDLHSLSNSIDIQQSEQINLKENLKSEIKRIQYWKKINIFMDTFLDKIPFEKDVQIILFVIIIIVIKAGIESRASTITLSTVKSEKAFEVVIDDDRSDNERQSKEEEQKLNYFTTLIRGTVTQKLEVTGVSRTSVKLPLNF